MNVWSSIDKPAEFADIAGDIAACILADGRVLTGALHTSKNAIWDPASGIWTQSGTTLGTTAQSKQSTTNEETWVLLRDGCVRTVEVFNLDESEKYVPAQDKWVSAAWPGDCRRRHSSSAPGWPH
jgi:hypothetical protein